MKLAKTVKDAIIGFANAVGSNSNLYYSNTNFNYSLPGGMRCIPIRKEEIGEHSKAILPAVAIFPEAFKNMVFFIKFKWADWNNEKNTVARLVVDAFKLNNCLKLTKYKGSCYYIGNGMIFDSDFKPLMVTTKTTIRYGSAYNQRKDTDITIRVEAGYHNAADPVYRYLVDRVVPDVDRDGYYRDINTTLERLGAWAGKPFVHPGVRGGFDQSPLFNDYVHLYHKLFLKCL